MTATDAYLDYVMQDERQNADTPDTDANVYADLDWTLEELHTVECRMAELDEKRRDLREVVASFLAETDAQSIVRPMATVKTIPGSERVSYDRKALDTLCRDDADLAFRLAPYRKATTTAPSLRVEWTRNQEVTA